MLITCGIKLNCFTDLPMAVGYYKNCHFKIEIFLHQRTIICAQKIEITKIGKGTGMSGTTYRNDF